MKVELTKNPSLLIEAANFAMVAGEYHLVTSQTLDHVAKTVNKLASTNLSFEGTHQYIRDIQVFNQLNVDAFSKIGVFSDAQTAKSYLLNATDEQLKNLTRKLNGTGQEVDWLRYKQEKFSNLIQKSRLLGEEMSNAPGVDGETIHRLTGKTIVRTSIKAAEDTKNLGTNISGVLKSLEKGTLNPNDILVGIEGTEEVLKKALETNLKKALQNGNEEFAEKLKQALEQMKVQELNTTETVKNSTKRLKDKMLAGKADPKITFEGAKDQALQGAVVGAALGLTVASITNYIRFKKGEITEEEAFTQIGRDTIKGALSGGAMSTVTLFLPAGPLGLIAGMAVGMYLDASLKNLLDEIFGKGAFEQILHSAGYTAGMVKSLEASLLEMQRHDVKIHENKNQVKKHQKKIQDHFDLFDEMMKG